MAEVAAAVAGAVEEAAAVATAAGLASLLGVGAGQVMSEPKLAEAAARFGRRLAYCSTALFLATLVVQRKYLHRVPDYAASSATLSALQKSRGGLQVHSPASSRCVPRRVSAWAKARWPAALLTSGGLWRY